VACDPSNPGSLFCDGHYVDSGNNLQNCINALKAELNITVTTSARPVAANGSCEAEGEAEASCATAPVGGQRGLGGAAAYWRRSSTGRSRDEGVGSVCRGGFRPVPEPNAFGSQSGVDGSAQPVRAAASWTRPLARPLVPFSGRPAKPLFHCGRLS